MHVTEDYTILQKVITRIATNVKKLKQKTSVGATLSDNDAFFELLYENKPHFSLLLHLFWLVDVQHRGIWQAVLPLLSSTCCKIFSLLLPLFHKWEISGRSVAAKTEGSLKRCASPRTSRRLQTCRPSVTIPFFCGWFQTPSLSPRSSGRCRALRPQIPTGAATVSLSSPALQRRCLTQTSAVCTSSGLQEGSWIHLQS